MDIESNRLYTRKHVWVTSMGDDVFQIGVTEFLLDSVTDVGYIELPTEGSSFKFGECMGIIEGVENTRCIYAPCDLVVNLTNEGLEDNPVILNESPYTDGWMLEVIPTPVVEIENNLLSPLQYKAFCLILRSKKG